MCPRCSRTLHRGFQRLVHVVLLLRLGTSCRSYLGVLGTLGRYMPNVVPLCISQVGSAVEWLSCRCGARPQCGVQWTASRLGGLGGTLYWREQPSELHHRITPRPRITSYARQPTLSLVCSTHALTLRLGAPPSRDSLARSVSGVCLSIWLAETLSLPHLLPSRTHPHHLSHRC
ncbi:hypothetical protein F4808DRAFT_86921 [Astrocystis sublimbata]|nr:hypothetical protein F4808DRAFT_86921 [Astrocystis sublimbata]